MTIITSASGFDKKYELPKENFFFISIFYFFYFFFYFILFLFLFFYKIHQYFGQIRENEAKMAILSHFNIHVIVSQLRQLTSSECEVKLNKNKMITKWLGRWKKKKMGNADGRKKCLKRLIKKIKHVCS